MLTFWFDSISIPIYQVATKLWNKDFRARCNSVLILQEVYIFIQFCDRPGAQWASFRAQIWAFALTISRPDCNIIGHISALINLLEQTVCHSLPLTFTDSSLKKSIGSLLTDTLRTWQVTCFLKNKNKNNLVSSRKSCCKYKHLAVDSHNHITMITSQCWPTLQSRCQLACHRIIFSSILDTTRVRVWTPMDLECGHILQHNNWALQTSGW